MVDEQVEELTPRQKHLAWCKERALGLSAAGKLQEAVESMFSDLGKEDCTRGHDGIELGMMMLMSGHLDTQKKVDHFIEGFN